MYKKFKFQNAARLTKLDKSIIPKRNYIVADNEPNDVMRCGVERSGERSLVFVASIRTLGGFSS